MLISELFYSVQGEGLLAGVPSVFVRTSGCNLRCRWCDTPYASSEPEGEQQTVEEIVARVREYPARHVVLTGGEPMLAKGIEDLAGMLKEAGYHVTIETAGTIEPDGIACDLASLSPKLADSTPDAEQFGEGWSKRHEESRIQQEVLNAWAVAYSCQFKFVVSDSGDLEEIEKILEGVTPRPELGRVLLMPEGTNSAALQERSQIVAELCKETGYRFCPRLHIDLYGDTKGT